MLHATEILGAETFDSAGNFVGRVKELFIVPDEQPGRVARLLLSRGKFRSAGGPIRSGRVGGAGYSWLHHRRIRLEPYNPNEAWLAIQKDLLDQQIIDTQWPKSGSRERCGSGRPANQWQHGNPRLRMWTWACPALFAACSRASSRQMRSAKCRTSCPSGPFAGSLSTWWSPTPFAA